ncbi:1-deoxy-D-xylulose-5-phosphate synthase [Phytohabitans kaempferiae]|uniref:1-deoxy-D-xylulose-5-phosphate synthase n=1 Tax=Phytohabitans kaempferiae TaxID=1620943 RepID=A0ABV6M4R2_9ACTN
MKKRPPGTARQREGADATPLLEGISQPGDLLRLSRDDLRRLAAEIRGFLVRAVCRGGGHLGPNLGVVELTMAVHRVFRSPHDRIIFDTGHQSYVHKILTGRRDWFGSLRQYGGMSGYPSRAESDHDLVENSHASSALAWSEGLARGFALDGDDRAVVAVVGDGALTGGMAWEALNNLARSPADLVVVLNDNGRSYAPTVGGLAAHLAALRTTDGGRPNVFTNLGLAYLGPVDGHDLEAVERALHHARALRRTVVVHCVTGKGQGFGPAETDEADHLHTVGVVDPETGRPAQPPDPTWTDVFADEMLAAGELDPDLVAVSAAMVGPTGLGAFARRFPHRVVDVGIAEQQATTSAAGLAAAGKHPVVAIYATFLNRAFDQVLMDVALHESPVTFVLDRAGITGPDGPSHHGVWDLAVLGTVPGLRIAAPRDQATLREELRDAIADRRGPNALRFPKARVGSPVPALHRLSGVDILRAPAGAKVLIVSVGVLATAALEAATLLSAAGIECTVLDPRWVRPVNPVLGQLAAGHSLVVTIEDGVRDGGVGSAVARLLTDLAVPTPVRVLGLPTAFLPHGGRQELLAEYGLDAAGVAEAVQAALAGARQSRRLSHLPHTPQVPQAVNHA